MKIFKILLFVLFFSMPLSSFAQLTDYHAHCIPQSYRELLSEHNMLFDEGFPLPQWTTEAHLQLMAETGITTSVLTLPAPHPYFGNQQQCNAACRRLNNEMASLVDSFKTEHQNPFQFCAILPLPDVNSAITEARYALDTLGAIGVKLATNVYGQYLGDSVLDPLMQFLSERHALVILHPHKPSPVNNAVMQQTPLAMQEYLSESTRAVCNMISRNVLVRYPNIRVVVPHAGAYLPIALARMQSLYPVMHKNGLVGEIDFAKNINCLWFDLAGSPSDETIRSLLTITTPDHLLYGTDFPYVAPQVIKANIERMRKFLGQGTKSNEQANADKDTASLGSLIIRIAEIEIYKKHLADYLAAATKVGAASVETEPGVICIFPMQVKDKTNTIRIVEIYRNKEAYQSHLQTPHFLEYKQATMHMVRRLRLIDTNALAPESMQLIFNKLK